MLNSIKVVNSSEMEDTHEEARRSFDLKGQRFDRDDRVAHRPGYAQANESAAYGPRVRLDIEVQPALERDRAGDGKLERRPGKRELFNPKNATGQAPAQPAALKNR